MSQFPSIPPTKLTPSGAIVSEPFSERGGGSQVLSPFNDARTCLSDSPWPNAVNEDSSSVAGTRFTVRTFDEYHRQLLTLTGQCPFPGQVRSTLAADRGDSRSKPLSHPFRRED